MSQLDEYLRAVEQGLRCPVARRPAIIEELGAHLRDRVEALVGRGLSAADAERQARREMGPAWLLALRLSAANGWSVTAHLFREIWATGIGVQLAVVGSVAWVFVVPEPRSAEGHAIVIGTHTGAYLWVSYAMHLSAFPAFGFSMGRLIRGWLWGIIPALVLWSKFYSGFAGRGRLASAIVTLAAVSFLAAVAIGSRKELPRRNWLAWVSVAVVMARALGSCAALPQVGFRGVPEVLSHGVIGSAWPGDMIMAFEFLALPWLFWLGAWLLDRQARGRLAGTAA